MLSRIICENLLEPRHDFKGWKNPGAHALHFCCEVGDPGLLTYFPGGHRTWAVHLSVFVLLFDVKALKNPNGHASQ